MVTRLCQMLAPMLAFTAEEAWEFIPGKPTPSVHLSEWEAKPFAIAAEETADWTELFAVRSAALPELEKARQAKLIGKSLEARLHLSTPTDWSRRNDDLRELLNVSQLQLGSAATATYTVAKADGAKCERCWHTETAVGANTEHPTLCPRCVEAVKQTAAT
jgi:isoleucyl-tRNA synthetase